MLRERSFEGPGHVECHPRGWEAKSLALLLVDVPKNTDSALELRLVLVWIPTLQIFPVS